MSSNKSFPASQRKLLKARLNGDVAKSRDLSAVAILTIGNFYIFTCIAHLSDYITRFRQFARLIRDFSSNNMLEYAELGFREFTGFLATFFALLLAVAIAVECLQVGFYFSLKPLALDFNKLNPFEGFKKNILKLPGSGGLVVEIVKMLAVIFTSIAIWFLVLRQHSALFIPTLGFEVTFNPASYFIFYFIVYLLAMLLLVALLDYFHQLMKRAKRLRMDVNEFRQEMRESEGDPHLRGMRKQLHQELGLKAALDAVKRSKILFVGKE